jgi:hypothetical protein
MSNLMGKLYEIITFDRVHHLTDESWEEADVTFISVPEDSVDIRVHHLTQLHEEGFELLGSVNGVTFFKHTLRIPPPPQL